MKKSLLFSLFPLVLIAGILTAGFYISPNQVNDIPLCFIKYFINIDCPGCGLTRSFLSIPRGDILGAIHYNAAGPLIYFLFLTYLFDHLYALVKPDRKFIWPAWLGSVYGSTVVLLLFGHWIIRAKNQLFH